MIQRQKVYALLFFINISSKIVIFIILDAILYHGETWELMGRRWGKIEKDFCTKNKRFDISKIPDIYDCIKYDLQHNNHTLQFDHAEELYIYAKYLADIVIPQVIIQKYMYYFNYILLYEHISYHFFNRNMD